MSVGLLLLSHDGIGSAIFATASQMIVHCPLNTKLLAVPQDCNPEEMIKRATLLMEELDTGDGVLILSDLYGSTPCNIALACTFGNKVMAVAGLNLPMLIRVMNYPQLNLAELTIKALSGGKDGVVELEATEKHAI